jgi:hypothetical protein
VIRAGSTGFLRVHFTASADPQYLNAPFVVNATLGLPLFSEVPDLARTTRPAPGLTFTFSTNCLQTLISLTFDAMGVFLPSAGCVDDVLLFLQQQAAQAITGMIGSSVGDANLAGTLTGMGTGALVLAAQCLGASIPGYGQAVSLVMTIYDLFQVRDNCFGPCPPSGGARSASREGVTVASQDPNTKTGADGIGPSRYIGGASPLAYGIQFENVETATAPAQDVVVTDQLDPARFDLSTFSLGPISFGDDLVVPPAGSQQFTTDVDLRPEQDLLARIQVTFSQATGLVTWSFSSIDPATGLPTDDPLAGFLPPNVTPPEGDGLVTFTVAPLAGLVTGDTISNQASIVFDTNPAILTPVWTNTIDKATPVSAVTALPPVQTSPRFTVSWSGSDAHSGIRSHTVYVSENGGPFEPFLVNTPALSGAFTGEPGTTYAFYSIAADMAFNQEPPKASGEAATQVQAGGAIGGTIRRSGSGQPLAGITAQVHAQDGALVGSVQTDAAGTYVSGVLGQGTYFVRTSNTSGFLDEAFDDAFCASGCDVTAGTPVPVPAGPTTGPIDFTLLSDAIFADGVESGDFSAWTTVSDDGGDLSVAAAAALEGVNGLRAFVDDANSLYVQDDTPDGERRYRARFMIDPSGFDTGIALGRHRARLFLGLDLSPSTRRAITVVLRYRDGQYAIMVRVQRDDGTRANTAFHLISAAPHTIQIDWQRASAAGVGDGRLELWIDGTPMQTLTGIDNDTMGIDAGRLGGLSLKPGAAGVLLFDFFESRRLTYITP